MKYAICNELYGDWPFETAFAHARKTGYRGIELAPFTMHPDVRRISPMMRRQVRQLAEEHELEIVGLHWLLARTEGLHVTHPEESVREQTAEYLRELAFLCRDLGGRLMVFGSPKQRNLIDGVSYDMGVEFFVDGLQRISPTLEECNVTLALEPLGPEEGNFMLTAQSAIDVVKAVDSPMVKLHLDVKAMSTESIPIADIIRNSKNWLVHFHANDPNRRGPGMGKADFVPIFQALKDVGYDGWMSVEVFDYEPGARVLAEQSIRYLEAVDQKTSA